MKKLMKPGKRKICKLVPEYSGYEVGKFVRVLGQLRTSRAPGYEVFNAVYIPEIPKYIKYLRVLSGWYAEYYAICGRVVHVGGSQEIGKSVLVVCIPNKRKSRIIIAYGAEQILAQF